MHVIRYILRALASLNTKVPPFNFEHKNRNTRATHPPGSMASLFENVIGSEGHEPIFKPHGISGTYWIKVIFFTGYTGRSLIMKHEVIASLLFIYSYYFCISLFTSLNRFGHLLMNVIFIFSLINSMIHSLRFHNTTKRPSSRHVRVSPTSPSSAEPRRHEPIDECQFDECHQLASASLCLLECLGNSSRTSGSRDGRQRHVTVTDTVQTVTV